MDLMTMITNVYENWQDKYFLKWDEFISTLPELEKAVFLIWNLITEFNFSDGFLSWNRKKYDDDLDEIAYYLKLTQLVMERELRDTANQILAHLYLYRGIMEKGGDAQTLLELNHSFDQVPHKQIFLQRIIDLEQYWKTMKKYVLKEV